MEVFVGTSGWAYSWNQGGSLDWYVRESGLNAIELNSSFYRFPYPNVVKSWAKRGAGLAWVVKVHRLVTHRHRLSGEAVEYYERFRRLFEPLEEHVHYYLLQLPPSFRDLETVEGFLSRVGTEKIAIEFRHPSLFTSETRKWGERMGVLVVSVDAPSLPRDVMSKRVVYERVHGRSGWYSHEYSREELVEIRDRILSVKPERVYVFFNNNHAMLDNAREMKSLLEGS